MAGLGSNSGGFIKRNDLFFHKMTMCHKLTVLSIGSRLKIREGPVAWPPPESVYVQKLSQNVHKNLLLLMVLSFGIRINPKYSVYEMYFHSKWFQPTFPDEWWSLYQPTVLEHFILTRQLAAKCIMWFTKSTSNLFLKRNLAYYVCGTT